jgi:5S rRNA maturation endonuclease (ribonuclease M5)
MHSRNNALEALNEVRLLLSDVGNHVDLILVEGPRDLEALRNLGYSGRTETLSKIGVQSNDLVNAFAENSSNVLILTDFDEEGRVLERRLTEMFEKAGVKVEKGIRRRFGRLMGALRAYEVEDLENAEKKLEAGE